MSQATREMIADIHSSVRDDENAQTDLPMSEVAFQAKIKSYLEGIKKDFRSASDQAIAFGAKALSR